MTDNRQALLNEAVALGLTAEQAARLADAFFACMADVVREATKGEGEESVIRDLAGRTVRILVDGKLIAKLANG